MDFKDFVFIIIILNSMVYSMEVDRAGFTLKTIPRAKAVYRVLMVILCFTLAGCQRNGAVNPLPAVNMLPLPTHTAERSPTPSATATIENTATVTLTPTPEYTATPEPTPTPKPPPFFDQFVSSLVNGNSWQVVGVFVDKLLALKVVQQPASNPAYVSSLNDVATYFTLVMKITGNTGLLAHNYLAGIYYFDLRPGQSVVLIYGDGRTEEYVVSNSQQFQALSPNSPTSNFVSIATGETLTSTDLFYRVYGGGSRTTLQTCIAQGNEPSWGRLFVIAPQE